MDNQIGYHNTDIEQSQSRLFRSGYYKDCSTICLIPSRGMMPAKVTQSWLNMLPLMNQKFMRIFIIGMEIGEAYSQVIETILQDPNLSKWSFILTLEDDNMPPPDGLPKLVESINQGWDVVGGLYWTKGEEGQPMIYGDPKNTPVDFIPQVPALEAVQPCNGLGMGFTLFRLSVFKDQRLPKPFFKTLSEYREGQGVRAYTQDLYFFENIKKLGYRVACDTRVKVGHYDYERDIVW